MPRPSLRSLDLTGPRATVRSSAFWAIIVCSVVAWIGYLLPAHREVYVPRTHRYFDLAAQDGEAHFHSNFADGGALPLVALGIVAGAAFLLRRKKLFAGMVAGGLAAGGAFVSIASVLLAHFLSRVETAIGDDIFALGLLGLFVSGASLLLGEPILYILERRHQGRASRPAPLPVAVATRVHS